MKTPGISSQTCNRGIKKEPYSPLPHQQTVVDYFKTSVHKGLLLFHQLGSGKTCTAIYTADSMLQSNLVSKVFILSPGNLRKTWVDEYCKKCGLNNEYIRDKIVFITYNFNIEKSVSHFDFNNSLVIIDETHNLINGVKNQSKNPLSLYNKILNSDCKVLALSGTPIYKSIDEFLILGKILKVDEFNNIEDITNPDKLSEIISFYPGSSSEYYPRVIMKKPFKILMTDKQLEKFNKINNFEIRTRMAGMPKKGIKDYIIVYQRWMLAIKYMSSRQVSNFFYDDVDIINTEKVKKRLEDKRTENGGWINSGLFKNKDLLKRFSPKFTCLFVNIIMHWNSKHVLLTTFKDKSGVKLIHSILSLCGITSVIYSGDINDTERDRILTKFNDPNNRQGQIVKILLLTEAGIEGISIKEAQHFHILETSTVPNKTKQGIGRVVRFRSHIDMPIKERYVNIWKYWSVTSLDEKEDKGVDSILYKKGLKSSKVVENFFEILKKQTL